MPQLKPLPPARAVATAPVRPSGTPSDPQKFKVAVRASAIDGQGAFADEAIPARRKIGEIRGESISVREARRRARGQARIMIVEISDRRAIDAARSADPLRFTNHSCQPNAVLRIRQGRVEFYAMRDIARGEELTVDYGPTTTTADSPAAAAPRFASAPCNPLRNAGFRVRATQETGATIGGRALLSRVNPLSLLTSSKVTSTKLKKSLRGRDRDI